MLLASTTPDKVRNEYEKCREAGAQFTLESLQRQLKIYRDLGLFEENVTPRSTRSRTKSMSEIRRYRRNAAALMTAVRLDLDTVGFTYRRLDGDQVCNPGDWPVDNIGDVFRLPSPRAGTANSDPAVGSASSI